jgi:putative ABC transport system permease protein
MFIDTLFDIYVSIKQQKLRTFLTGFGVAWGIFILTLLLGASGGLEKGILQLLNGFAQNSIWIYGGNSTADKGDNKVSKPVLFSFETIDVLETNYSTVINAISPESDFSSVISYEGKGATAQIKAVMPDYFKIKILRTNEGRIFNSNDNQCCQNVVVIGKRIKDQVFGNKVALHKEILIGNHLFLVIGILEEGSIFNQSEQDAVFIPYKTALRQLNIRSEFGVIGMTLKDIKDTQKFETNLKRFLGRCLNFDPDDTNALYVFNFDQQVSSFQKLFKGLNIFLWFIGICLLMSGVVGVANIMIVIVNERTPEIGIRKAIGATNQHILWMILLESAFITLLAGIIGILLGSGTLMLIRYALQHFAGNNFLIRDVSVNWLTIIGALIILIFSGIVAGLFPAKKATEIEPIDAIRYE